MHREENCHIVIYFFNFAAVLVQCILGKKIVFQKHRCLEKHDPMFEKREIPIPT